MDSTYNILKYLAYFNAVTKYGSLTKAANRIYISQPALSKAIHLLEEALDCDLFVRTMKGIVLTPQGEILCKATDESLQIIEQALLEINIANGNLSSNVRIGAGGDTATYFVLPLLNEFEKKHSEIRVLLSENKSTQIYKSILNGDIDIGFVHSSIEDPRIVCSKVCSVNQVVVVGEKYSYLKLKTLSVPEMARYPLILYSKDSEKRRILDNFFSLCNCEVNPSYEASNTEVIIRLVENNKGIAIMPKSFISKQIIDQRLFNVTLIEDLPKWEVWMIYKDSSASSEATAKLIKFLFESKYNQFLS